LSPTDKDRAAPGVFINEKGAFPPSLVGVETAIAGFIGYTAKAEVGSKPVGFKPVKIDSLADFEAAFGDAFRSTFDLTEVPLSAADFAAQRWNAAAQVFEQKYYALVRTSAVFNLYNSVRLFYANGGRACYVVSVGDYTDGGAAPDGALIDAAKLTQGLTAIGTQTGPTMLVVPDAVLLTPDASSQGLPASTAFNALAQAMLAQCGALQDRVAILDVYGADALDPKAPKNRTFDNDLIILIESFQNGIGDSFLNYGMAYFPFLVTSIVAANEIDYRSFDIRKPEQLALLQGILTDTAAQLYPDPPNPGPAQNRNPQFLALKKMIAAIPMTTGDSAVVKLNDSLTAAIPLLAQMEALVAKKLNLLPPSSAMAGVYTFVDASRGVWNAPANMTLNSVASASVKLTDQQQSGLNAPLNGKAVNVIRDFVGRGPVVWGARTLDGNSLDYRYIQVRRTLIYIEASIKAALSPFAFAANDGKAWIAVTAMVSAFLTNLWSMGGLMGAKADEAFTVQCGLGSTMTSMDILEGTMIVQVTLQMIRPAEFVALTFRQKMEGVG